MACQTPYMFLVITAVLTPLSFESVVELSFKDIDDHIRNQQWTQPLCILFLEKTQNSTLASLKLKDALDHMAYKVSKMEKNIVKVMPSFEKWKFGKFYFQGILANQLLSSVWNELLRCYIGTASSHDFDSRLSLKKWMCQLRMIYNTRIEPIQDDDLNVVFHKDLDSEVFIITLPGSNFFEEVEVSLHEVRKSCQRCRILIVPPGSKMERAIDHTFSLQLFPTLLIYHRERAKMVPRLKKVLRGLHSSTKDNLLLHILVLRSNAEVLTMENFESTLRLVRNNGPPLVVCFYSSSNPESYTALHALERSALYFKRNTSIFGLVKLRFGLVDLAVTEHINFISRYLNILDVKSIPFLAIFWGIPPAFGVANTEDDFKQKIFNGVVPTPWNIHFMLKELKILPDEQRIIDREQACFLNTTIIATCFIEEKPLVYFGPNHDKSLIMKKKARKLRPVTKKVMGMPLLTDKTWSQTIENTSPIKKSISGHFPNFMQRATVKLVIFIMADCAYCEIMMPSFANLTKFAERLYGTSVYLMNCTSDPINCKRHGVAGYPTLSLFRSVSEEESKSCLLPNSTSSSVRLDYHGNMQMDDVLSWLSKASMSAVHLNFSGKDLNHLKIDVRLVAYVYTKPLASKYLSRWLQLKLIPFQCFKLACEKLFGGVECVAKPSRDVITEHVWKGKIKEQDLVLEQVQFERRDGASATMFKLSYPMDNTLERDNGEKLHRFHNKHRYNIPAAFRCEDNHPLCIDIIVKFVEDHRRLPVTHITREGFHAYGTSASIFSKEFPVLIALVHGNDLSSNSSFLTELEIAAHNLYTKLIVATLNVDEFPSWASQFVPRDYHYNHHADSFDSTPALYYYPRLCIIEWDDHQHAAFYPPVDELEQSKDVQLTLSTITATNIIDFTYQYLNYKDRIVVETEMF